MSGTEHTGFDAVILAGGRSSRLGGEPKAGLLVDGEPLLVRSLRAAGQARRIAVAGPPSLSGLLADVPFSGVIVREEPVFSGPAAAVAAALAALGDRSAETGTPRSSWTLLLACDMPEAARAVSTLVAAAGSGPGTSVLAVDSSGKVQPLAGMYRTADLLAAAAAHPEGLANLSMFSLLARVQWREIAVPEGSTADVDTWADAARWGIQRRPRPA